MAADPNDSGMGQPTASGVARGRVSTSKGPFPSTNPVARTGRPDGTTGIVDDDKLGDRDGDGSTTYRGDRSANPTARTGRPDADMNAPRRSYDRVTPVTTDNVTDVSAGRIIRSAD